MKWQEGKIKDGEEIVIVFQQFSKPDGKVVFGSLPSWIYFKKDGVLKILTGQKVEESELRLKHGIKWIS